jgi:hypothetical protein
MAKSTLGIVVDQANKSLTLTGLISIREIVTVTVTGGAYLVENGGVLKIQGKYNKGLTTPIASLSTWTLTGDDATGELNTNTIEAIAAFANTSNTGCETFNVLLYSASDPSLQCNGFIQIKNFPSSVTTSPVTLDQATSVAANTAAILLRVAYADFSAVDDVDGDSSIAAIRTKLNDVLAILRND